MLGANPLASNGSLMTAPDMRGRLRAIRARGGKLVVIDPRRSRTAEEADEHHFIRPGTDALLLFAHRPRAVRRGPRRSRRPVDALIDGLDDVRALGAPFTPEAVAPVLRDRRRRIRAASRASSPRRRRAAVYGRIGTCTQEFGTLAQLARRRAQRADRQPRPRGRRDVPARRRRRAPTRPARRAAAAGSRPAAGRAACAGSPRCSASCPVACLAEEIETPGEGQVRALITICRQPGRLDAEQRPARRRARPSSTSWSASTSTSTRRRATPT